MNTLLQIVPHAPSSHDGVSDYALKLAERLQTHYGVETKFAVSPLDSVANNGPRNVVLHYVNYGYHKRGLPLQLPSTLRQLRETCGGKLLTVFHELYASSPPWQSAFWLQPIQKSIARNIARISDACVVSSDVMRDMLQQLAPGASISVHPVMSTLGEPTFSSDQFVRRDPHRWVIFGGTHLVKRSLKSFRQRIEVIPDFFSPRELFVLGGSDSHAVRDEINEIRGINCYYQPAIEANVASDVLSSCSFAWIDYFHQPSVPTAVILKSGSFASHCAHGVIPVLPHEGSVIALRGERLPGPYFVETARTNLPALADRAKISADIYEWYRRHSSIEHLAKTVAATLQMNP